MGTYPKYSSFKARYKKARKAIDLFIMEQARSIWIDLLEEGKVDLSQPFEEVDFIPGRKPLRFGKQKDALYEELRDKYYACTAAEWENFKEGLHKQDETRLEHRVRLDRVLEFFVDDVLYALNGADQFSHKFNTLAELKAAENAALEAKGRRKEIKALIAEIKKSFANRLRPLRSSRSSSKHLSKAAKTNETVVRHTQRVETLRVQIETLKRGRDEKVKALQSEYDELTEKYF